MNTEAKKVLLLVTVETQTNETKSFAFTDNESAKEFIKFAMKQEDVFECYTETIVDDLEVKKEELSIWLEDL